jgi:tetratricopeptide (TPR) repeat protein
MDRVGTVGPPHVLVCAIWIEQEQMTSIAALRLLNSAGSHLFANRRYSEAEPLYERSLSIAEQKLGADHPDTLYILKDLARLYLYQEKYAKAEPLYERSLSIAEQKLASDHLGSESRLISLAHSLYDLAVLYTNWGKYAKAEPLFVHVLSIFERIVGRKFPHTLYTLEGIVYPYSLEIQAIRMSYADLLRAMGRNEEAKQIEEKH